MAQEEQMASLNVCFHFLLVFEALIPHCRENLKHRTSSDQMQRERGQENEQQRDGERQEGEKK